MRREYAWRKTSAIIDHDKRLADISNDKRTTLQKAVLAVFTPTCKIGCVASTNRKRHIAEIGSGDFHLRKWRCIFHIDKREIIIEFSGIGIPGRMTDRAFNRNDDRIRLHYIMRRRDNDHIDDLRCWPTHTNAVISRQEPVLRDTGCCTVVALRPACREYLLYFYETGERLNIGKRTVGRPFAGCGVQRRALHPAGWLVCMRGIAKETWFKRIVRKGCSLHSP